MLAWSTFDIIIVCLGIGAVLTYLVIKIIKFKREKDHPELIKQKKKKKGKADKQEDADIIDND